MSRSLTFSYRRTHPELPAAPAWRRGPFALRGCAESTQLDFVLLTRLTEHLKHYPDIHFLHEEASQASECECSQYSTRK